MNARIKRQAIAWKRGKWLLLAVLSLTSTFLYAQQPATQTQADTTKRLHLEEVDVTGKTAIRTAKEQAFNVNVIDAKQLYNSSADLNQALNRSTGVRIREDGGLGSAFSFSLNGFTGRQVKFFLDGLPMDNFGSSLTLNNFPATMAERIEIYKGVLPVSLGADALGGAVNIVTRASANYLDVSYGYGSFNTHKAGINGAFTDTETGFTVRANAFYNYSDNNYKVTVQPIDFTTGLDGPEQEVERFHDSYRSIGAQVDIGVTGRPYADHLLIGAIAAGNNKDIQTGVTMEQVFGARTSQSNSIIPTLKYKKTDLFTEGLDLTVYSAYNLTTNHFVDTTRFRFNWLQETVPTSTAELSRTQLQNKDNEALASANLAYGLTDNHAFSLNYMLTDFRRKSSDVENPGNVTFLMPQGLRKQNLGLAWQATYTRFTATAFGKLYMLHAKSFENVSTNTVPDYRPTEMNRTNAGYGAAAAYFIVPRLQAKVSYEHTYRLPEATELLGDGLYVRRNSALRPEKSDNLNAGALYTALSGGPHQLHLEGNFIFRNAKDYIRQDQQQVQPVDRQYINVGNVRTTGGEAEIRYSWNNSLFASVNATFQDIIDRTEFLVSENLNGTIRTRNLNYGYRLPNMPYLFGNVNLGGRFHPAGNRENTLNLNYSASYVEKYYLTPNQIGLNNHDAIPRQISHDLLADYAFGNGKYVIALECRNLANSRLYDNYLLQKPGRSFFLKLRYFITS
ncbi:MAG TPA: TonB-dependent receptor [Parapedobacter sp.]|nr:TonB-dependent receptor [Parapedobacter sp.]